MAAFSTETVLEVKHWTDNLFSFKTTRGTALRFQSGQFIMIGLEVDGKPLTRAYSVTSAPYDEFLEFYSIKVPNGPLTSRLQHIESGSSVLVGTKPVGTLLLDNLLPGRNLWLLSTGTGIAPFGSVLKDPATYAKFSKIVLVHGCRFAKDLEYGKDLVNKILEHALVGEEATQQLVYLTTLTREPHAVNGRISTLLAEGQLGPQAGVDELDPALDRVMLCGGPEMLTDLDQLLKDRGFKEGSSSEPADYVIEKAFVEK
jgi:ferredoxin/flavodoxin---NADP+ reductase